MPCGALPIESKIALVTGGGSGINLSFVKLALKSGARGLIIADLRLTTEAQELVDGSEKIIFSQCDVTKRKDLESLITASVEKFGEVPDIYVAGAGVFEPEWSNWWSDTEEDRYAELDINVTHVLKLSRIATRALLAHDKKGAIVITASQAGYAGLLSAPMYCASKHAVVGFVRSMADLDRLAGIKVMAVAPGLVHTPLWTARPDIMQRYSYDEKAAVTPDYVAGKMIDLIVKDEYVGGTCLEVSSTSLRLLGTWNIPAPETDFVDLPEEFRNTVYAPFVAIIDKERRQKG